MNVVAELMNQPGVIAAGQYTYRGDRFSYRGNLSTEQARMASIMCRTTTLATAMGGRMLAALYPRCVLQPIRGWAVRGEEHTLCVAANYFCFINNRKGSLNKIIGFLRQAVADEPMDRV